MHILAIDTALEACSVALVEAGLPDPLALESEAMERGHAEALMPMVERVIQAGAPGFEGVGRIAVAIGPGSFTGLRVGISAARAFAMGLGVPAVGVTTLSAYAAPIISSGIGTLVAAAIDARHGQVYLQVYAPAGRTVVAPRITPARDAARQLGSGPVRIVGSGAEILAAEARSIGIDVIIENVARAPDITWIARLGLAADPAQALPKPLYLRPPDAKPQDHVRIPRR